MSLLQNRRGRMQREETRSFWLFCLPWLFGFVFLMLFPLGWGLAMSLTNYTGFNIGRLKFVGLDNFIKAVSDPDVGRAAVRTLLVTFTAVPIALVCSLLLALVLNRDLKAQGIFRTVFYIPHVFPVVVTAVVWQQILNKSSGLLNAFLGVFRPGTATNWIMEFPNQSLVALYVWAGLGGSMIIFLAGLKNIPEELYESARMDGAGPVQSFLKITFPLLSPVVFFQFVTCVVYALQLLIPAVVLNPGQIASFLGRGDNSVLPPPQNRLIMVTIYENTFTYSRFGYGLALSWFMFIAIMIITLILLRTSNRWVYYEVDVNRS